MLHVPRARSMTNWASICGLRCNQKENRNTHHTVGPTGIDVEHHLQGNYDTRTTTLEIYFFERMKKIQRKILLFFVELEYPNFVAEIIFNKIFNNEIQLFRFWQKLKISIMNSRMDPLVRTSMKIWRSKS